MNKMGNKGFMLLETMIVSTIILSTLVFLYVQFSNIKVNYDISFRYNTIPGLYAANEVNNILNEYKIINDLANNLNNKEEGYLDITNLSDHSALTTSINESNSDLFSKIVSDFNINKILYTNDNLDKIKNKLKGNNYDKKVFDEEFKNYIKNLTTDSTTSDRLIVEFKDNTFASILVKNSNAVQRNNVCSATKGDGSNIGDEITCGTESFYVYNPSDENSNIRMLAKYNLKVGGSYDGIKYIPYNDKEMTNIQDKDMKGFVSDQEEKYGTTAFSTTSIDYTGSIVKEYVDKYEVKLEELGVTIEKATLITKEELEKLGCITNNSTCTSSTYSWIYSSSYWTSSNYNNINVYGVDSSGAFGSNSFIYNSYFGVRPVIIISKDAIK